MHILSCNLDSRRSFFTKIAIIIKSGEVRPGFEASIHLSTWYTAHTHSQAFFCTLERRKQGEVFNLLVLSSAGKPGNEASTHSNAHTEKKSLTS